jgi:hypothetical protein
MRVLELDLVAVTDLCLSSSNHTLGRAETHDYVPGRLLWGALANRAYRAGLPDEQVFRLFHQGALRILDGVPALGESRAYPAPASWHFVKDSDGLTCFNFADAAVQQACLQGEKQYKACRSLWLTCDRQCVKHDADYSLRTAVDPTGKARDGLLHGLSVLRAGATFWSAIMYEEKDEELIEPLLAGELRVGRSRNAELGILRVAPRKNAIKRLTHGKGKTNVVSVFCVSRCLFRNPATGAPTLRPEASQFCLPSDWALQPGLSFIRLANIVHFNSKRARPETERFAIEAGSVLTFCGEGAVDLERLTHTMARGVGEHRGQGYGEVLLSPSWLTETADIPLCVQAGRKGRQAPEPSDELFRWAKTRAVQRESMVSLHKRASAAAAEFRTLGVPSSQWGVLRSKAREARFLGSTDLFEQLFKNGGYLDSGKRKLSRPWEKVRDKLEKVCKDQRADLSTFLELLAGACMRPSAVRESQNGKAHQ